MQPSDEKNVTWGFGLALLILSIIGIVCYWSTAQLVEVAGKVMHTHQVLGELETLLSELKDAETGQRGYVITGDERYLEPYHASVEEVKPKLQEIAALTADNPNQQRQLRILRPLVASRLTVIQQTIELRKNKGFEAALQLILTDKGKRLMDEIRDVIHDMEDEEQRLLQQRSETAAVSAQVTTYTVSSTSLLFFSLVALATFFINSENIERKRAEKALRQAREELERLLR